jgi:hypothetical protein
MRMFPTHFQVVSTLRECTQYQALFQHLKAWNFLYISGHAQESVFEN